MHLQALPCSVARWLPATDANLPADSVVATATANSEIRVRAANYLATHAIAFHSVVIGEISDFPDSHVCPGPPAVALKSAGLTVWTDEAHGDLDARVSIRRRHESRDRLPRVRQTRSVAVVNRGNNSNAPD
jgi:hypothetical protein